MKGRVRESITKGVAGGPVHFTLIDPDKTRGEAAGKIAREAEALGTFAVLIGGSTGITPTAVGETAAAIHRSTRLPVIVFPQGPESLNREADALLFMSLLNSRNLGRVVRIQARSALAIRTLGLEPIPAGYIVVAPGMRVGEVGEADCVDRADLQTACGYALAAEYFGMSLVYLEAGSGAPSPVPQAMIRAVKQIVGIPLMVGGGIRTASDAKLVLDGGADILVTGTVVEEDGGSALAPILDEVRRHRGR